MRHANAQGGPVRGAACVELEASRGLQDPLAQEAEGLLGQVREEEDQPILLRIAEQVPRTNRPANDVDHGLQDRVSRLLPVEEGDLLDPVRPNGQAAYGEPVAPRPVELDLHQAPDLLRAEEGPVA